MEKILSVFALMAAFAAVGLLLRRLGVLGPETAPKLNALALNVTVPAGVFLALHDFPVDRSLLGAPLVIALVTLALWPISDVFARVLRLGARERAVFVIAAMFGNTAFIGFPIVRAVLGEPGLSHAVLIDQIGAEPLAFSLGALLASAGALAPGESARWRKELLSLLLFPPLWALAAGLAWSAAGLPVLPGWVQSVLRWVSTATVPLVMIAMGLLIRAGSLARSWRPALGVAAVRLVVSPALALVGARVLGLAELPEKTLVLEAGMPTMMFTLVLVTRAGLDAELAAAFITATLIGGLGTLPAWLAL